MNKKGFTLVELLAIIVVLGIILVIAIPNIINIINQSRKDVYVKNEEMMVNATRNYLLSNTSKVPLNIGDISIIQLSDLRSANLLNNIIDPKNNLNCDGKIIVSKKSSTQYTYNPYLECGNNYKTYTDYITDGLLLHLDGYNAPVSNVWNDSSGNGNNATLTNMSATVDSGYDSIKKGYSFDGINDYLNCGTNAMLSLSNEMTFEILLDGDSKFDAGATLFNRLGQTSQTFYWFMIYQNKSYMQYHNGTNYVGKSSVSTLPITYGERFVYTIKYNITAGQVSYYINGQLFETISVTSVTNGSTTSNLYIGSYQGGSWYFDGHIYDVKIYNRILTDAEILYNYNVSKQRYGL